MSIAEIEPGEIATLTRGASPLLISLPHSGTALPAGFAARLTMAARALSDTDWHVEKLYAFAKRRGVSVLEARFSRFVIDLNRDPSGASLYPGKSTTELCPLTTFADEPIYLEGMGPDEVEIEARKSTFFAPYHALLARELERIRAAHGYAILLDGHSIRAEVPRFFAGTLPDLNLGTADGTTAAPSVERAAAAVLARSALSHVSNGRFKGGYITRFYGRPQDGVHALQLEMGQRCYMDEAPPYAFEPARAARLTAVLTELVDALLEAKVDVR